MYVYICRCICIYIYILYLGVSYTGAVNRQYTSYLWQFEFGKRDPIDSKYDSDFTDVTGMMARIE